MANVSGGGRVIQPPTYTDGRLRLYKIVADEENDFPVEQLKDTKITIWYSELSVYDHMRYQMNQAGIEVTMKIRIPKAKEINSKCVCKIEGEMHRVYNVTHIKNKDGFPETEITLMKWEKEMEVIE